MQKPEFVLASSSSSFRSLFLLPFVLLIWIEYPSELSDFSWSESISISLVSSCFLPPFCADSILVEMQTQEFVSASSFFSFKSLFLLPFVLSIWIEYPSELSDLSLSESISISLVSSCFLPPFCTDSIRVEMQTSEFVIALFSFSFRSQFLLPFTLLLSV